jgi:hypothetical protein
MADDRTRNSQAGSDIDLYASGAPAWRAVHRNDVELSLALRRSLNPCLCSMRAPAGGYLCWPMLSPKALVRSPSGEACEALPVWARLARRRLCAVTAGVEIAIPRAAKAAWLGWQASNSFKSIWTGLKKLPPELMDLCGAFGRETKRARTGCSVWQPSFSAAYLINVPLLPEPEARCAATPFMDP